MSAGFSRPATHRTSQVLSRRRCITERYKRRRSWNLQRRPVPLLSVLKTAALSVQRVMWESRSSSPAAQERPRSAARLYDMVENYSNFEYLSFKTNSYCWRWFTDGCFTTQSKLFKSTKEMSSISGKTNLLPHDFLKVLQVTLF